jgi:hypothetical protein
MEEQVVGVLEGVLVIRLVARAIVVWLVAPHVR